MSGFGAVGIISGGLQLIVPSYGLRLVRRFGAQSVGWFLVIAFSSLALLHLFTSGKTNGALGTGLSAEAVCAIGALLLLVGMGHLETMFSERAQGQSKEQSLCGKWESRVKAETADLVRHNRELAADKGRCEERLKALENSETRYRLLFEENPQPMWIFDLRTHRILLTNAAALRLYGFKRDEFIALNAHDLLSESAVPRFQSFAAKPCSGVETPLRWQHRRKDNCQIDVEMIGFDLKYDNVPARLVLISELSARRQRETESRNALRLDVVGQVAGGFAHHFNNLLAIIDGSASLLIENQTDAKSAGHLKNISAAVNRAAALTRQLVSVGGHRPLHIVATDLNALLRSANHLLRRLIDDRIAFQHLYGAGLPLVLADIQLIEQIVVNLVLNARDAMSKGGTITISTSTVVRKDAPLTNDGQIRTGEFVRLAVRDTGCGMTPEVQARLFEPFFTTKDVGRGTGLGLASVYGALRQQSGWLEFTSEPGKGSEFRIFLPCAPASAVVARPEFQPVAMLGTILLVEPDDRSRGMARCILNWSGYRVIAADGSALALMLWDNQAANIDLLLVDSSLSDGMSGSELAQRLLQAKSKLKVVFASAADSNEGGDQSGKKGSLQCVAKPYRAEVLLQTVQASLTGGVVRQ